MGGIDYDTIVDNDYPSIYADRPILIPRKPVEIFETSPPPKEIASAISLLKDYMIEGDAAIQKHKPKVDTLEKTDNETKNTNNKPVDVPSKTKESSKNGKETVVQTTQATTTSTKTTIKTLSKSSSSVSLSEDRRSKEKNNVKNDTATHSNHEKTISSNSTNEN